MPEDVMMLTEKLLDYTRLFLKYYQDARERGSSQDFEKVVKPFADEVKQVNNQWKVSMEHWLKKEPHKHIYLKQIGTTHEHIERMSIQCFFPETSRSRFLNANRTAEFFLLTILEELKK